MIVLSAGGPQPPAIAYHLDDAGLSELPQVQSGRYSDRHGTENSAAVTEVQGRPLEDLGAAPSLLIYTEPNIDTVVRPC